MENEQRQVNRIALTCLGLAACAFLGLSLISFDIHDWPNPSVAGSRNVQNLCGPTGAFLAYQCRYYLGPATVPLLGLLMTWLVLFCMQRQISQPILRSIGVVMIAAVGAAGTYLFVPASADSLTIGNGGILGVGLGHFLLSNMAKTGATLVLLATLVVGLLLAADDILWALLQVGGKGLVALAAARPAPRANRDNRANKREQKDTPSQPATWAVSQRDAAIQAVTSIDMEETATAVADPPEESEPMEQEPDEPEVDDIADDVDITDSADVDEDEEEEDEDNEEASAQSVQAVSTALAQMLGKSPRPAANAAKNEPDYSDYKLPSLELLADPVTNYDANQEKWAREQAQVLTQTLQDFNINAQVVSWDTGPVITMYELELAPGIKVAQISNLANDLARSLGAAAVRVVAPIPGKHTIGIEVPNQHKEVVRIKGLLQLASERAAKMNIPLFLGKDASGTPLVVDMTSMPHCLIAGTTGSGKSVCMNTIITSILLTQRPDLVKMILVDPKMVEMNAFRDLAQLMCPIVTEMKRAEQILEWLTVKMDERYALLAEARVRNIDGYNKLSADDIYDRFNPSNEMERLKIPLRLPYIVVMIDELADLMMTSAKQVEAHIIRLAQKSRAVGIHLVLATQRPQATVVTGLIKSNLPCRISFRVSQRMDSRIVLDQNGAETLLGQGDMLFLQPGTSELVRAQGSYVSDDEIHDIVKYLKEVAQPHYSPELIQMSTMDTQNMEKDELFDEAVDIVLETRRGSVSLLQRRLTIGYSRASRLVDQMALAGIVGEYKGSQAREVLITREEYKAIQKQMAMDEAHGFSDLQDDAGDDIDAPIAADTPQQATDVVEDESVPTEPFEDTESAEPVELIEDEPTDSDDASEEEEADDDEEVLEATSYVDEDEEEEEEPEDSDDDQEWEEEDESDEDDDETESDEWEDEEDEDEDEDGELAAQADEDDGEEEDGEAEDLDEDEEYEYEYEYEYVEDEADDADDPAVDAESTGSAPRH